MKGKELIGTLDRKLQRMQVRQGAQLPLVLNKQFF